MSASSIFLDDAKSIYFIDDVLSEESFEVIKDFCVNGDGWQQDEYVPKTLFYIKYPRPKCFSIMQEELFDNIIKMLEPELVSRMMMPFLRHSSENTETDVYGKWSIRPNTGDERIKKNFTYFINDDYTGGEFIFLNKDITVNPKKNSLLVYPSSNLCASKEITDGQAYTFTEYLVEEEV